MIEPFQLFQAIDGVALASNAYGGYDGLYAGPSSQIKEVVCWAHARRYTEDGELTIDNNVSERTVKMQAIGRKNWLFVASVTGGQRAAALYSLIASCKANQVEPWAYLRDIFTRLPALSAAAPKLDDSELDQLLPDRWLQAHPQHRWNIDEVRRKERQRRRQKLRQRRKR